MTANQGELLLAEAYTRRTTAQVVSLLSTVRNRAPILPPVGDSSLTGTFLSSILLTRVLWRKP